MLTLQLIDQARDLLREKIFKSPLEYSKALSKLTGVNSFLKYEFLQPTGSFKIRGAYFRLAQLSFEEKARGIATASTGNHGKAIAYAAKDLGIKATVYVPKNIDETKLRGILSYGASAITTPMISFDETEAFAEKEAKARALTYISAFDDPYIMAANGGTLAAEIHEQLPSMETLLLPVGGGGLAAGAAFYAKECKIKVIPCQHQSSPSLAKSLEEGHAITKLPGVETLASALEGGLGQHCFQILKNRVDTVPLVNDLEIIDAVRFMLEQHQFLIEPSAAVTIAAAISKKLPILNGPAVFILTGRNVSTATLNEIL